MLGYIIRRTLISFASLIIVVYLLWFFGVNHGLDFGNVSAFQQWITTILQGNLGYLQRGRGVAFPITALVPSAVIASLSLLVPAILLQQGLSLTLALYASSRYRSIFDRIFTSTTIAFVAMPSFWLALLFSSIISVNFNWFPFNQYVSTEPQGIYFGTPAYGHYFQAHMLGSILDIAHHLILPIIILVLATFSADGQFVRTSMLEVLSQEYINAARARGIPQRTITWKHALRNALLPLITNVGIQIPRIIFVSALIEYIFGIPGIGWYFCRSVFRIPDDNGNFAPRDTHLVVLYILLFALITFIFTILTDIAYAFADPRLNENGGSV